MTINTSRQMEGALKVYGSGQMAEEAIHSNKILLPSGGLMADVPCMDHSLDGCKGYPEDVQTTKHA